MRYCVKCVLPESRPNLQIDKDGVCGACRQHAKRSDVDWSKRRSAFVEIATSVKDLGRDYDCVIPVSGGKDSTWQVVTCLELGLKPLAVTWRPPGRTALGQRNLDNLIQLGVDHIDYSINPEVERHFTLKTFKEGGSTAIPMHLAIFSIPVKVALAFDIPLVVWGENSATEYGGREEDVRREFLDSRWVHRYGVTQGTTADDWIGSDLSAQDLAVYVPPSDAELSTAGIRAVFLGHYFPWDPEYTRHVAAAHGFQADRSGPKTGAFDYADIDDSFISIHHWMKWYKFGFTRTYDNLSLEIRNGRLTREQAVDLIANRGDETPWEALELFANYAGESVSDLVNIACAFRNREIWVQRPDGVWEIPGFLVENWNWLVESNSLGSE